MTCTHFSRSDGVIFVPLAASVPGHEMTDRCAQVGTSPNASFSANGVQVESWSHTACAKSAHAVVADGPASTAASEEVGWEKLFWLELEHDAHHAPAAIAAAVSHWPRDPSIFASYP
jgi:hypothetical protein